MEPITVPKDVLLAKLQENRDKHRKVFLDALAGYSDECKQVLTDHLNQLRNGKTPRIQIIIDRPEDHTRDYDRVIGMLMMDIGETFVLDEQSYKQYVDDDWVWKRQWIESSTQYAAASVAANYQVVD